MNGTPPKPTLTPDEPTGAVTALEEIPAPLASLGAPASEPELPVDLGPARAPAVEPIVEKKSEKASKTDETPTPPPARRPGMWLGLLVAASGLSSLLGLLLWLRSRRTQ